jgi:hypothetical protein
LESRPLPGGFCSARECAGNQLTEVFNMFVDKLVEKPRRIFVSDSPEDASTLCTTAGAGTFGVGLVAKIFARVSFMGESFV